jgi:hypothetical protein
MQHAANKRESEPRRLIAFMHASTRKMKINFFIEKIKR